MHFKVTDHGFEWGSANIFRLAHCDKKGWIVVGIDSAKMAKAGKPKKHKHGLQVCVTRTGKMRVFLDGAELKKPR